MKKVIIIGGGMGGLYAGNLLARKGYDVTIFESHFMPGGYTAGFFRNGFYFESGTLSFESSERVFAAMRKIGALEKINFKRHDPIRYLTPDFDVTPKNYLEFKEAFYQAYPSEKERLDGYFKELDSMYHAFESAMGKGNAVARIGGFLKIMLMYKKYKNVTLSQFTGNYFAEGTKYHYLFNNLGFYPDSPPLVLGAALYSLFEDYWRVRDGMQAWADVLADNFRESGGELKLGAYVEKILTRNGEATGVLCMGTEYPADYVISACDYKETFLNLLDSTVFPPEMVTHIRNARVSEGIFVVYLGLDCSNATLLEQMKSSYMIYLDPDRKADVMDSDDTGFFDKTPFWLFSPSIENEKLAPEGKSSLMISAMSPYRWQNNWGENDREKYLQLKNRAKDTLIARASRIVPCIGNAVVQDAATPRTFERYTHNTEGATSAWSWNPRRKFYKNIWSVNTATPVKNLFIGSCWASQIGGIPGALAAAEDCAKKIK